MTNNSSPQLPKSPKISLRDHWLNQPEKFTGLRQIEIAHALGVTEGEWVDACRGHESQRLSDDPKSFLQDLPALGEVMVLTRNSSAVHEKTGCFDHIEFFDRMHMAQVANHEVDLRLFLNHWHRLYAVTVTKDDKPQHSLQVFDCTGTAVLKIFMRPATQVQAWNTFVGARANNDNSRFQVETLPPPDYADPKSINLPEFRLSWDQLKDTHEFFGLLKRFQLNRIDALRIANGHRAQQVDPAGVADFLKNAATRKAPLMIFVANRGCIQIHTGPVENIVCFKHWLNVLDERFNLHLREDHIAEAWIVRKPTKDGAVTSLELYDTDGQEIAMLFGERKPGQKERSDWRDLIGTLKPFSV